MRFWKNYKGVSAYLIVVIGVVTLRCDLSWAKSHDIQKGQDAQGVERVGSPATKGSGSIAVPPVDNKVATGVNATASPVSASKEQVSASGPSPMPVPPRDQAAMQTPPPFPPGMPPPPNLMKDQAVLPNTMPPPAMPSPTMMPPASMKDAAGPEMPSPFPPGMPPRMPQPGMGNASPSMMPDDELPPPERVTPPPAPRRMGGQGPRPRDERNMPRPGNAARGRNAATNETDIYKVVPQTCVPARGQFIWNFEEEELINILRQVSDLLCKTIVVNDAIGKNLKMTIIGKSPLSPKDAWDVLMASLASKGLALIEQGKTWTVVKRAESKSYATPMYFNGKEARSNEEIGTLFYKAQHASQEALKNVARVLISKDGMVDVIGDQFIIVIDSNSNLRRLGNIFAQVDVEDAINKINIISLLNAEAKTIEKQLRELFDVTQGPRTTRRRSGAAESKSSLEIEKIIADERTNSIIIVSDKESFDKLKEVVALIDQPAPDQGNKGKIHVKKLRFEGAKKIADTLSSVVQGKTRGFSRRRPEDATHELFEGEVKITAHESTNTLVTVATPNDYRSLLITINSLDVRKEQVYVEAVILDIQVNDDNDFGINLFGGLDPNWLGGNLGMVANPGGAKLVDGVKTTLTAGATGMNISGLGNHSVGALAVLGNFLSGGVAGISGKPMGDLSIPSFGAVLQAISRNTQVDVLSTPYLLTTDNTEAEMSVGEKVPVMKGTSSVGGASGIGAALGVPMQNIAYEDVKLTFKITPHVGDDDNVRLDINQEVNEIGGEETILQQKQYRIRTKSAKTTLVLKDQQTGVIGGLISHQSTISDNKIPLLGDIPVLGWLFKNRNTKNTRKNLLLIITPYVIRTDDDYKKIVERKLREREEFAAMYYGGKIKNYNKFIDYDKKAGPLSSVLLHVDSEMGKTENGGIGTGGEMILKPKDNTPESDKTVPSSDINNLPSTGGDETVSLGERPITQDDFILDEFDSGATDRPIADRPIADGGGPADGG